VEGLVAEEDDDLHDVMREERSRGKRHLDMEARREFTRKLETMRAHLRLATEEEFLKAMRDAGLKEGSAELELALRLWREFGS
jgi:hypothetical protein